VAQFPLRKLDHDKAIKEIHEINALNDVRMRLTIADGQAQSIENAIAILGRMESHLPGSRMLRYRHTHRRLREPFLYAAKECAPEFLSMDFGAKSFIGYRELISQIAKKADNRDQFRKLCEAAKAAAPTLKTVFSSELVNAFQSIESVSLPLQPIPDVYLEPKAPRRPAKETKIATRQSRPESS
jgi:hypothetical protein